MFYIDIRLVVPIGSFAYYYADLVMRKSSQAGKSPLNRLWEFVTQTLFRDRTVSRAPSPRLLYQGKCTPIGRPPAFGLPITPEKRISFFFLNVGVGFIPRKTILSTWPNFFEREHGMDHGQGPRAIGTTVMHDHVVFFYTESSCLGLPTSFQPNNSTLR